MRAHFAGLILGAFLSNVASAEVLECKIKTNDMSGGYVTDIYYFDTTKNDGSAQVADALIQHFEGGPITAKVTEDTAKKTVFNWNVVMTNSTGQVTNMRFRAAYMKGDKSISVRATPSGFDNNFEGRGKCKVVQP